MSRTINCKLGDGSKPKGELPVLRLGNPLNDLTLQGEQSKSIDVGVSFDVPVLVFESSTTRQDVSLVNTGTMVPVGGRIIAQLRHTGPGTAFFERGDTLLCVVPLVASDGLELSVSL